MTGRLLWASLTRRFRQLALIFVAVAVAAATVTTMANFAFHARQALARGLAAFGPNLIVRPEVGAPPLLPEAVLTAVTTTDGVAHAAGVSAGSFTTRDEDGEGEPRLGASKRRDSGPAITVVAVTREWPALHSTWQIAGRWASSGQAVLGEAVRQVAVRTLFARRGVAVSGRLSTGNWLDRAVIVPWSDRARWGLPMGFQRIEVRTTAALATSRDGVKSAATAIDLRVPGVEAEPVLKVSGSDAELSSRVTLLLLAVSLVTLILSGLAVMTATSALVGERRAELALWFSLGARSWRVGRILALEFLAASLIAAVSGAVLGLVSGVLLSRRLLHASVTLSWLSMGVALLSAALVAIVVVAVAMLVALSRIRRLEPAAVLAGE